MIPLVGNLFQLFLQFRTYRRARVYRKENTVLSKRQNGQEDAADAAAVTELSDLVQDLQRQLDEAKKRSIKLERRLSDSEAKLSMETERRIKAETALEEGASKPTPAGASADASAGAAAQIQELTDMLAERDHQIASFRKRIAAVEPWQGKGAQARCACKHARARAHSKTNLTFMEMTCLAPTCTLTIFFSAWGAIFSHIHCDTSIVLLIFLIVARRREQVVEEIAQDVPKMKKALKAAVDDNKLCEPLLPNTLQKVACLSNHLTCAPGLPELYFSCLWNKVLHAQAQAKLFQSTGSLGYRPLNLEHPVQ